MGGVRGQGSGVSGSVRRRCVGGSVVSGRWVSGQWSVRRWSVRQCVGASVRRCVSASVVSGQWSVLRSSFVLPSYRPTDAPTYRPTDLPRYRPTAYRLSPPNILPTLHFALLPTVPSHRPTGAPTYRPPTYRPSYRPLANQRAFAGRGWGTTRGWPSRMVRAWVWQRRWASGGVVQWATWWNASASPGGRCSERVAVRGDQVDPAAAEPVAQLTVNGAIGLRMPSAQACIKQPRRIQSTINSGLEPQFPIPFRVSQDRDGRLRRPVPRPGRRCRGTRRAAFRSASSDRVRDADQPSGSPIVQQFRPDHHFATRQPPATSIPACSNVALQFPCAGRDPLGWSPSANTVLMCHRHDRLALRPATRSGTSRPLLRYRWPIVQSGMKMTVRVDKGGMG
jgi:hypothetical protein